MSRIGFNARRSYGILALLLEQPGKFPQDAERIAKEKQSCVGGTKQFDNGSLSANTGFRRQIHGKHQNRSPERRISIA